MKITHNHPSFHKNLIKSTPSLHPPAQNTVHFASLSSTSLQLCFTSRSFAFTFVHFLPLLITFSASTRPHTPPRASSPRASARSIPTTIAIRITHQWENALRAAASPDAC